MSDNKPENLSLIAEVFNELREWSVTWYTKPYEGWDALLSPTCYCDVTACACCDGINVTTQQVEALRAGGVEFTETGERKEQTDVG